jgi:hypothetical protein
MYYFHCPFHKAIEISKFVDSLLSRILARPLKEAPRKETSARAQLDWGGVDMKMWDLWAVPKDCFGWVLSADLLPAHPKGFGVKSGSMFEMSKIKT